MNYAITIELRRDKLEDDFKVYKQMIHCPIPITSQMLSFIENTVNTNVKDKEYFVIKAVCSIEAYTLVLQLPYFRRELHIYFLQTYDGDKISIESKSQIF